MKNTMKYIVLAVFIVITFFSNSQTVKFEKVYGGTDYDYGYSAIQTFDNGYIVAGNTSSFGAGSADAYILKTDSMGVAQWQKTYGGINVDHAYSIKQTTDTGFVIAGYTNSFGQGGYDMYIIKTNKTGDVTWSKTYGGSDWDFAYSIEQTTDGGYIITGGTYSYGKGGEDMYLVKINSVGDTLWTKTYGGAKDDEAKSVKQTNDGGYILTGFTKSMGDSLGDIYTIKTNSLGDTLWTKKFGGAQADIGNDVLESVLGGYIIGGETKSFGAGGSDGVIIKLSPTDSLISYQTYGGSEDDGVYSIAQSAGGRYAMIGYTYTYGFGAGTSDFITYIENPFNGFHSGTYGGNINEKAYSINNTKDNGYIICGYSDSYSNLDHIFLVKTDSNGNAPTTAVTTITNINLSSISNNAFKIFPNPASDNVFINILDKTKIQNKSLIITITDIFGRKYCQQTSTTNNISEPIEISTKDLFSGIYFITIVTDTTAFTEKIVVQH